MQQPLLRTERLCLRPLRAIDATPYAEQVGDFEVCKYLSRVPYPYSLSDAVNWIENRLVSPPSGEVDFAIDQGQGLIGYIGIRHLNQRPAIGYWLGRQFWSKGLMSEALEKTLAWFFRVTDHERIVSGCFAENEPSLRVLEKFGFEIVSRNTIACLARGEDVPNIDLQLSRKRFTATAL